MNEIRRILRRGGLNTDRKLAVDLTQRGVMVFSYADGIRSAYSLCFWLRPRELTPQEKYAHNLKQMKDKGRHGKFFKGQTEGQERPSSILLP